MFTQYYTSVNYINYILIHLLIFILYTLPLFDAWINLQYSLKNGEYLSVSKDSKVQFSFCVISVPRLIDKKPRSFFIWFHGMERFPFWTTSDSFVVYIPAVFPHTLQLKYSTQYKTVHNTRVANVQIWSLRATSDVHFVCRQKKFYLREKLCLNQRPHHHVCV